MEGFVDQNTPSPATSPVQQITGDGIAATQPNPLEQMDEQAGPEEQGAYEDLLKRAIAMIHDSRGPNSVSDNIIKALSNDTNPAYVTIGKQAGTIMQLLYENAKRQGIKYPPAVIREVGIDVVTELTDLARESGAMKKLPDRDGNEMQEFDQLAVLEATKYFGEYMMKSGQAKTEEYQDVMKEQMDREASSGALDDWNMEEFDPAALEQGVANMRGFGNGT